MMSAYDSVLHVSGLNNDHRAVAGTTAASGVQGVLG